MDGLTIPMILEAAKKGDPVALMSLKETGFYLGIGLASLINALNPQKIVLGGYLIQAYEFLLPHIEKVVQERALRWPREVASIEKATYLNDSNLMGAIAAAYSFILSSPGSFQKVTPGTQTHKEAI